MVRGRSNAGVAVSYGHIYVIGGCEESNSQISVEKYDHESDSWSLVTFLKFKHTSYESVEYDGLIYFYESMNPSGLEDLYRIMTNHRWDDECYIFNPSKNELSRFRSLPTPRLGFKVAVLGRRILFIGGHPLLGIITRVESHWKLVQSYNLLTKSWGRDSFLLADKKRFSLVVHSSRQSW